MDILWLITSSSSLQAFVEHGIRWGIVRVSPFDFLLQANNNLGGYTYNVK